MKLALPVLSLCSLCLVLVGCPAPETGGKGAAPESVVRHNILGTAYLGQQKWTEAEEAFRAALAERPDDPLLLNNAAVAVDQQGRRDEADALLRRALAADPEFPHAHYNLGLLEKESGNFAAARDHFAAVAAVDPDDLLTQYNLGIVLSRIDENEAAEAAFRKALELNPIHVSSLYGLGRLLITAGDEEEGARLIRRSQQLRAESGLNEAVGTQYGEEGPYAMGVDYDGSALAAPEPIDVAFAPTGVAVDGARDLRRARGEDGPGVALVVASDAGVAVVDAGGASTPVAGEWRRILVGDVDGDAVQDRIGLRAGDGELVTGDGRRSTFATPIPDAPFDAVLVDRDHDGDLDVFACWAGADAGCLIATNDGSGAFDVKPDEAHGFAYRDPAGTAMHVGFSDLDNDRDVDLLVGDGGSLRLFTNQRDGSFADISVAAGFGTAAPGEWAVLDLDKDGWMDLLRAEPDGGLVLHRNVRGSLSATSAIAGCEAATRFVVIDHDNDGFLDVACADDGGAPTLLRNLGAGGWSARAGAFPDGATGTPRLALDADGDGDLDLAVETAPGRIELWRNEGGNAYGWIRLDSVGVGDNRFGVGAKVEVLAGALRQKFEIVDPAPLHVGIGPRDSVQSARYLWPGGVLQDEISLAANRGVEIEQLDRKGTSCPLLYAWRDGAWRFVTDFLGGAAVGYQQAPGVYNTPDPDEYVRIPGGLDADDGLWRVRFNNQLEEVIWFDAAELVVVDHPLGTEVYADEKLMPGPPFPEFRLFASGDVRPVRALDPATGRDRTAEVAELDRRTIDDFALLPFKGYAEEHALELDLGSFGADERVVLLLDGWIDYADSSSNVAAHQAGRSLMPPRLQVADGRGGWHDLDRRVGFPAGLTKAMTVDLTGAFRGDDRRVRLITSMRLYWDRIRVMVGGGSTPLEVRRVAPARAELRDGGFPEPTYPGGVRPPVYLPASVATHGGWKAHLGRYTGLGEVEPLLRAADDAFVTTRNGDEIELAFPALEPPRDGWTRTFFVHATGFGKDMDPNSAANTTLAPIPFHGMPSYPYGADVVRPESLLAIERAPRVVTYGDGHLPGVLPLALADAVTTHRVRRPVAPSD